MTSPHEELAFDISTLKLGRYACSVSVTGELDAFTAPELRKRLAALPRDVRHVLVDLTHAPFVDSVGLATLLSAARRLKGRGGELMLVVDDPRVLRVLKVTGVDRFFAIRKPEQNPARELVGASLLESL